MHIWEWPRFLDEPLPFGGKRSAVTVGVFDGVHRGHKALIGRIVGREDNAVPVVITFRQIRQNKSQNGSREYPGDIMSFRQKTAMFESLGVSVVIVIEFSESFRQTTGAEFFRILREHGNMSFLTVGSNFRCGYKLDTDAQKIREINAEKDISTDIVQSLTEDGKPISSSLIRAAVSEGRLRAARAMLGYPFTLDLGGAAPVVSGGRAVYDIAGRGLVLPPGGAYRALLSGGGAGAGKPADIHIEGGAVVIAGEPAVSGAEYAEFWGD